MVLVVGARFDPQARFIHDQYLRRERPGAAVRRHAHQ